MNLKAYRLLPLHDKCHLLCQRNFIVDFLKLRLVYEKFRCVKIVRICTRAFEEGQRMETDPFINKYMLSIVVFQLDA
jgi:hypothetical protein